MASPHGVTFDANDKVAAKDCHSIASAAAETARKS